jgi:hypothetical protein
MTPGKSEAPIFTRNDRHYRDARAYYDVDQGSRFARKVSGPFWTIM